MRHLIAGILLALTLFFSIWHNTAADAPYVTLLPGLRADYRFDYRGDGSQIRVALDASDANAVTLSIYTPEQIEAVRRGETVTPVGRGMPNKDHNFFWAGGFRILGVYHAVVENRSKSPISYRIEIGGEAVSAVALVTTVANPSPSGITTEGGQKFLNVSLPIGAGTLRLAMPSQTAACTPAKQIPATIAQSVKLCPNEIYPPLKISGNNIGLFNDDARTAVVTSVGRQFAITVEGTNNWIEGVVISAKPDPLDLGAWLCLYDECIFPTRPLTTTLRGGTRYGGGILLNGSNSTVHGVTVRGGTIGVATVNGRTNYIIDNQLNDLNGWGSYNIASNGSYFIGNILNRNNHGCTTPDGRKFQSGCETAGWVCLNCQANLIARNHCELSANCYYMSGERGLASNDNRLIENYCAGATDNCIEITFSLRNVLQANISTVDPNTDRPCKYPFWIGGSVVYFKDNTWECSISPQDAFNQARDSTIVGTNIINIDEYNPAPGVPVVAMPSKRAPVSPRWGLAYVE
ncbi:MAG: hypothetical protein HY782_28650 [Chloroflexi bacterium]|nr:hypothetical protein [Chloroflexota bacterium]